MFFFSGFTTDGEWNSLRSKGNTGPTPVFQIHANARAKFARVGINKMMKNDHSYSLINRVWFIVVNIGNKNGIVTASVPNLDKMMKMITLTHMYFIVYGFIVENIGNKYGIVAASVPNPAISTELLREIQQWYDHGATVYDVIDRLRMKTVPPGYATHSWIQGGLCTIEYVLIMMH